MLYYEERRKEVKKKKKKASPKAGTRSARRGLSQNLPCIMLLAMVSYILLKTAFKTAQGMRICGGR